jgi:hypothetical protein
MPALAWLESRAVSAARTTATRPRGEEVAMRTQVARQVSLVALVVIGTLAVALVLATLLPALRNPVVLVALGTVAGISAWRTIARERPSL